MPRIERILEEKRLQLQDLNVEQGSFTFEDIISEFNKKSRKIDERFDQLPINFNNYTNIEKPTKISENLTNKEIKLNKTILALRSENAQLLEKIRLLETKSPPNNDSNEQKHICYQVPVSNSFNALRNMEIMKAP